MVLYEGQLDNKGPFIIFPGGGLTRIRGEGSRQFQDSPRGGHEEIGVQEGGLSDFTILFYFKKMCSLLSAVLIIHDFWKPNILYVAI